MMVLERQKMLLARDLEFDEPNVFQSQCLDSVQFLELQHVPVRVHVS